MTKTLQSSKTDNASNSHLLTSALEEEIKQLKEAALMDKESASASKRKQPPLTMRETLTLAQERTGTKHFPELLPQEELSNEEIAEGLAMHKASVDKLSRFFSLYQSTLDKTPLRRLGWLWKNRIPLGGLTLVNGGHGTCKSLLVLQIAAAVSSGQDLPDGTPTRQSGVVIVAPYANAATILHPLLAALGADLSRIKIISYIHDPAPEPYTGGFHPFTLPEDFYSLSHAIEQVDARLVIMDNFMSLLSYEQRSTNERLRRLLTDLNQRMIERDVACILVRNCPARGSHTRPSLLERSDHFETIASSSLLLAPDPIHPDRFLLSHVDSNASALADTLIMEIQPLPDASEHVQLTVLDTHPLKADDLIEHRPDALRRQLLSEDILSFINQAASPVHVTMLYDHCSPASSSKIQHALKDLLNTEQIERPSRGIYTHLNITLPTTLDQSPTIKLTQPAAITVVHPPTIKLTQPATITVEHPPTIKLTQPAAITVEHPPTIKLTQPAAITSDPLLTNEFTESATTTLEPLPTNKLADAARPSDPLPTNELTEYTAIPTYLPPTNELTATAATTTEPPPTNELTATATTTTEHPPTNELTATATTTTEHPPINELTATAAITTESPPTNELTATAAITTESPPTNELTATAAITTEHPPTNELTATAAITTEPPPTNELPATATTTTEPPPTNEFGATTFYQSLTNRTREFATTLSHPSLINELMQAAATATDPSATKRIKEIAAILSNPSLTSGPNEIAAILTEPPLVYGLHEVAATASPFAVTNRIGQIACILADPSLTHISRDTATIIFNTSVTNRTH